MIFRDDAGYFLKQLFPFPTNQLETAKNESLTCGAQLRPQLL